MSTQSQTTPPKPVETSPLLTNVQPNANPSNTMPETQLDKPADGNNKGPAKPTARVDTVSKIQRLAQASTEYSWTSPAGIALRDVDEESLLIFRRAVGINSDRAATFTDPESLEKGRRHAVGIYRSVLQQKKQKKTTHHVLGVILYICHFLQIILAATLTALGPNAKNYEIVITVLGAINTITAGVLAVFKGSGMIERLAKDEVEFKKLQDWIEETESLLSVGIIGRNRKEVGILVEVAFKKYNACFGHAYEIMSSSDIGGGRDSMAKDTESGSGGK